MTEAQSGFACGERAPKGVIQLRMNNVDTRGNFVWDEFIRVPADAATIAQYRLEPEDVLFNNTNSVELVGKSAPFGGYKEPVVYSNHFTRLRTDGSQLLPVFLAAWLNHQWNRGLFANICNRWIGQSAVKADKLLAMDFPLPPIDEQKRIAAILNERMSAVERARKAAEKRQTAIRSLSAACLREVFHQEPLPKGWRRALLKEVATINPRRPGDLVRPDDAPTSFVPMVSVDATTGAIFKPEVRPFSEVKKGYTYFAEGDVLFAKITPCMQNGKHAISRGLTDGIGFGTTEFHVLRPGPEIIAEWIHHFLRQPCLLMQATEHFTGAVGQQRLPEVYLAGLEIPLPPIAEQRYLMTVTEEQLASIEGARAVGEEQLATINVLPTALLRKAFGGTL